MQNPSPIRSTRIIAVTSGKGGAGKTTVSTHLAMALSQMGNSVILLDADLGLANAQLLLGIRTSFNLSHVVSGVKSLQEVMQEVRPQYHLIPGASGVKFMASLTHEQKQALVDAFSGLRHQPDYIIIDTAAGISSDVLIFLAASHLRVVVVKDDPSSIADAYGIIKVMHQDDHLDRIWLVSNQVESEHHGRNLYQRIANVSLRFLGLDLGYLGSIEADEWVLSAQRKYQLVQEYAPSSSAARDFRRIADHITQLNQQGVLDDEATVQNSLFAKLI